jgi:hypothetical protein
MKSNIHTFQSPKGEITIRSRRDTQIPDALDNLCLLYIYKVLKFFINVFKRLNEIVIDMCESYLLLHWPLEIRRGVDLPYP